MEQSDHDAFVEAEVYRERLAEEVRETFEQAYFLNHRHLSTSAEEER